MVGGDPARSALPFTEAHADRWYAEVASEPMCWVIEAEAGMIGTARIHSVDAHNQRARYAIGIFSPAYRGRGYGAEATGLVLRWSFETLRLHRVELRVLEINLRAIRTYERCGFVREGVEREGTLIGGRWHSDVIMSILDHEYRALHPP